MGTPPLSAGDNNFLLLIFLLLEGEGHILGEVFVWRDQLFFLHFLAFVILWSSLKEYQILVKVPEF